MAGTLAVPAATQNAQLNIQVHGGIGFTWEHDAHLSLRRAAAIEAITDPEAAAGDVTSLARRGVRRAVAIDLPPEAEPIGEELRRVVERGRGLAGDGGRRALIRHAHVIPHRPRPRAQKAAAAEHLLIQ